MVDDNDWLVVRKMSYGEWLWVVVVMVVSCGDMADGSW